MPFSGSSFSPCRVTCAAKQSSAVRLKPGRHDHDVSAASTLRRVRVRVVKTSTEPYLKEAKEFSVASLRKRMRYPRSLRQAVNAAVHDPVVGIVNDCLRVVNGFQIYFIRFSIQCNGHLVVAGIDCINTYVRPGGDDPFHPLAIGYVRFVAIRIGDRKGIEYLQGDVLVRGESHAPYPTNFVKTP